MPNDNKKVVKKMQTQIKNNPSFQLDTLLHELNADNPIYGLEYIVDELYDKTKVTNPQINEQTKVDWFGLSDLSI